MKLKYFFLLGFLFFSLSLLAKTFEKQGAGVTVVVHGWDPDGNQPAWMTSMANAIVERNGNAGHIATITVTGTQGDLTATCSDWSFDLVAQDHAEIIVLLNWTAVANHLETGITAQEVAAAAAPKIYNPQNGQPALSELPIHLIGHSRGGGMVFEIARLLGLQGVETEHVTALDPHPLTANDPQPVMGSDVVDTPIKIYENVLFVDNYYQNIEFPMGEYIDGAYNRLWTSLPGGYHNETGYTYTIGTDTYNFSDHLNIILAYHGMIDLTTPTSNGEATMTASERAWFNAYENAGENTGFKYSRQIMGDRKSTDIPNSGDAVVDGYHNDNFLGGSGARTTIDWSAAEWPAVLTAELSQDGATAAEGQITLSETDIWDIDYTYRSYSLDGTLKFYLDSDRNPYNDNNTLQIGSQNFTADNEVIHADSYEWTIPALTEGNKYYLFISVENTAGTRYLYLNYEIEAVAAGAPQITSHPQSQSNICLGEEVNFSAVADNYTQVQWQESTDEGANWTDLDNNEIYSGTYTTTLTITVSQDLDENWYRSVFLNASGSISTNSALLETDSENPSLSCPGDQSFDLAAGETAYTVSGSELDPTETSDNCQLASVLNDFNDAETLNGAEFPGGTTTVVWTATDAAGNAQTCSFDVTVNTSVGISDLPENGINIYPNPTTGIVTIDFTNFANFGKVEIKITDISGKTIKNFQNDSFSNFQIDITNQPPGIYFLKIETGNKISHYKIIKK